MVFGAATTVALAPDPAITLFGRRISVLDAQPEHDLVVAQPGKHDCCHHLPADGADTEIANPALVPGPDNHDELTKRGIAGSPAKDDVVVLVPNDNQDDKNLECSTYDNSTICANSDQSSEQKVLKKPDKILPCPRCNSLDTKFCYYNNYNVNQPRYYCKNCERYWTDGGTMRNVPVGAGRRKNKHTANHYQNPGASFEGMAPPGNDVSLSPTGQMQPSTSQHESGNRMVLKFRSKDPHCQTEADPLNLEEDSKVIQSSSTANECKRDSSAALTVTDYTRNKPSDDVSEEQNPGTAYAKLASVHPVQCYPGNHWAFLRSPGWNNAAFATFGCAPDTVHGENGRTDVIPWNPTSFVPASGFVPPTIPFPFIPASFWGCMMPTGAWNAPLVGYNGSLSLSSSLASPTNDQFSSNQSLKMGKRFRDGSSKDGDKAAASLWFPKTLRIDDPDQAAKSSIWATLGIKHDDSKPVTKGTMFKCFQSDTERKTQQSDASEVLDANPAALSRSQAFQEIS